MNPMRQRCALALLPALLHPACAPADEPSAAEIRVGVENGMRKAFEWNLAALLSRDAAARREAVARFGRGWGDMRSRVATCAKSDRLSERIAAAWLVAKFGSHEDLAAMKTFLDDAEAKVRIAVMAGLARVGDGASVASLESLAMTAQYDELRSVFRTLEALAPERVEAVAIAASADEAWGRRRAAAQCLARLETSTSSDRLVALLDDPVWWIRAEAARGCASRPIRAARGRVTRLIEDPEWPVRAAAARALGSFGEPDDLALVARVANGDTEKGVRIAAARALAGFPARQALPILVGLVTKDGEHHKVKRAAVESVAALDDDEARKAFARLRADEDATVRRIVEETAESRALRATPGKEEEE